MVPFAVQLVAQEAHGAAPSERPPEMYMYRTSKGAAESVGSSSVLRPKMRRFLPSAARASPPRQPLHAEASGESGPLLPEEPEEPPLPELAPEEPPELAPELPEPPPEVDPELAPELDVDPDPELVPELAPELDVRRRHSAGSTTRSRSRSSTRRPYTGAPWPPRHPRSPDAAIGPRALFVPSIQITRRPRAGTPRKIDNRA